MEFLEGGEPASVRKESCNLKPILLAALGATGRAWLRDVHLQNAQGSESKKKEIIIKFIQIQTAGKNKYVSFSLITIKIYKNISDNLTHFFFANIFYKFMFASDFTWLTFAFLLLYCMAFMLPLWKLRDVLDQGLV